MGDQIRIPRVLVTFFFLFFAPFLFQGDISFIYQLFVPQFTMAIFMCTCLQYSWLARDVTGSLKRTVRHVGVQAANLHMSKCTCDSVF